MLVSKIKPCMSKYKPRLKRNCVRLIKSEMIHSAGQTMDTCGNSRANTCTGSEMA